MVKWSENSKVTKENVHFLRKKEFKIDQSMVDLKLEEYRCHKDLPSANLLSITLRVQYKHSYNFLSVSNICQILYQGLYKLYRLFFL